jgi:hypothetical protein
MLRRTLTPIVVVGFLCAAMPAVAADHQVSTSVPHLIGLSNNGLSDEVVGVESRPSVGGILVRDLFAGAVAGAAVGGLVAVCNRYCSSNGSWGNWQRDIGLGAAIGAGVGLLFGAVDAAANSDTVMRGPIADEREIGFSPAPASYGHRF